MKFTKDDAYKELVARMTARGEKLALSERTINGQLDTLIKFIANDETELDDFIGKVLPSFQNLEGQYRKDNSDFIKQWEKDHPAQDHKPTDPPADDYTKKLEERLLALEKKNEEVEKDKRLSAKKAELKDLMKKKGIKDDNWSDSLLSEVAITEDMDIEAKADSYLKMYNQQKAAFEGGATPGMSYGGGKDTDFLKGVKEYRKQMGINA